MGIVRNRFFKWSSSSLIGHLAIFQLLCALPLFIWSLATMKSEGTLTMGSVLRMALVCSTLVAVAAALFWYSVSSPLIKSRNYRK
jgi:hypothetical protein